MKKLSIIALAVAAVALWACSKGEPAVAPANAWMFDETLPVPIQLGGGESFSVSTKATDSGGKRITSLEGEEIWIGGFDLHIDANLPWGDGDNYCKAAIAPTFDDDDFLFSSKHYVRAKVEGNLVLFTNDNGTSTVNRYYPYSNTERTITGNDTTFMHKGKNYSFVAYHTPAMNVQPVSSGNQQLKTFRLCTSYGDTYNSDVLWARVDARPIEDPRELAYDDPVNDGWFRGFNARYQRRIAQANGGNLSVDDYPLLSFVHVASLIHIYVAAKDQAAVNSFNGNISIDKMQINSKFQYLALDLVSGELIPDPTTTKAQSELVPYRLTSTSYPDPIYPIVTPQEYNHGFFVMPGERTEDQRIHIEFEVVGIEGTQAQRTMKVDLPLPPETNGYEAGVEYNYYITIDSAQQILLRASLEQWDSTSGSEQLSGVEDIEIN